MLKHLMNNGSLLSYALYDAQDDAKAARDAQRAELLKNNTVKSEEINKENTDEQDVDDKSDNEGDDDGEEGDEEGDENKEEKEGEKLTPEQIKEKEIADKATAKAKRKEDRVQKRINEIAAQRDEANAKIKELEAKLAADPEARLTEEEVETRAEAKAIQKLKEAEIKKIQDDFEVDCEVLKKAATKIDKDFYDKIVDIAEQLGPIPSFLIGILEGKASVVDNGAEVMNKIINDEDLAEEVWALRPAAMTKKVLEISKQLTDAKKKPKKEISKVEVITPINSNNVKETIITDNDTKPENMDNYVAKRRAQMAEKQKARGY